jgi:acyl-CoA thioesterase FadM
MPTNPAAALENGVHRTQVRVRFGDTDPYGIVYFVS